MTIELQRNTINRVPNINNTERRGPWVPCVQFQTPKTVQNWARVTFFILDGLNRFAIMGMDGVGFSRVERSTYQPQRGSSVLAGVLSLARTYAVVGAPDFNEGHEKGPRGGHSKERRASRRAYRLGRRRNRMERTEFPPEKLDDGQAAPAPPSYAMD